MLAGQTGTVAEGTADEAPSVCEVSDLLSAAAAVEVSAHPWQPPSPPTPKSMATAAPPAGALRTCLAGAQAVLGGETVPYGNADCWRSTAWIASLASDAGLPPGPDPSGFARGGTLLADLCGRSVKETSAAIQKMRGRHPDQRTGDNWRRRQYDPGGWTKSSPRCRGEGRRERLQSQAA